MLTKGDPVLGASIEEVDKRICGRFPARDGDTITLPEPTNVRYFEKVNGMDKYIPGCRTRRLAVA